MSNKTFRPHKSDGTDQDPVSDVQTLPDLIKSEIRSDFAANGARVGAIITRVAAEAADDLDLAEIGITIDRMVERGELHRDGDRLALEADAL